MGDKKKKKSEKKIDKKSEKKADKGFKQYYLIDYENVHKTGFSGLPELKESDNVVIFYSGNANKITFELHQQILDSKAKITYFEVSAGGKNALDFQLSSYLGYLLGDKKKEECYIYIVSNDKGFEYISDFWNKRGFHIELISWIVENNIESEEVKPEEKSLSISQNNINTCLKDMKFSKDKLKKIYNIVSDGISDVKIPLSKRKQHINSQLCKIFGNNQTKEIYKKIKPLFK
ncbi:MAG: hypothetical protein K2G63_03060 [Oscillospiraceae bacterium]|nr:hypothetical protein [Oscillospiraceae bacterium]